MAFIKATKDGYILTIGTGDAGDVITEEEYNTILSVIKNRPHEEGYGFRLKEDLTWERYEVSPEPEPDIDDAEAFNIIFGGAE